MEPAAPRRTASLLPSAPQPQSASVSQGLEPAQATSKQSAPQPSATQPQSEPQAKPSESADAASTFGWAEQAEIVRSAQKDEYYCQVVYQSVTEAIHLAFGSRFLNSYKQGIATLSDLLYYSLTSLQGLQTLGEEYTDIRQVVAESETPPESSRRVAYILWKVILPYVAQLAQAKLVSRNRNLNGHRLDGQRSEGRSRIAKSLRNYLVEILPSARSLLSSLERLHLAWFYMRGVYSSPSHRLAGLKLMSFSAPRVPQGDQPLQYSILGKLIIFQESVRLWLHLKKKIPEMLRDSTKEQDEDPEAAEDSEAEEATGGGAGADEPQVVEKDKTPSKCMLCLGDRRRPTATSCGHVFCWTCVVEWASSKPECPLCRQSISVPSLLRLYHYQPV